MASGLLDAGTHARIQYSLDVARWRARWLSGHGVERWVERRLLFLIPGELKTGGEGEGAVADPLSLSGKNAS